MTDPLYIRPRRSHALVVTAVMFLTALLLATPARADDLRRKHGTKTFDAAQLMEEALDASRAGKHAESVKLIDRALKLEPDMPLGYYRRGLALLDMGQVDEGVVSLAKAYDIAQAWALAVKVSAALDLGLTYGKLSEHDLAVKWLSRAVLADPDNTTGDRAKVLRNLAVTHYHRKDMLAAFLTALQGYAIDPKVVPEAMVVDLRKRIETDEAGMMLSTADAVELPEPRKIKTALTPLDSPVGETEGNVTDISPSENGKWAVYRVGDADNSYRVLEFGRELTVKRVEVDRTMYSICVAGNRLFGHMANPHAIVELEPLTGKVIKAHPIPVRPGNKHTVMPNRDVAFFPVADNLQIHRLDLKTGKVVNMQWTARHVVADPGEGTLWAFHRDSATAGGYTMHINGRPVRIELHDPGNMLQTALMQFIVGEKDLVLAQYRENAASNGRYLPVSDLGVVGVVGGGGWRPANPQGKSGYGLALFDRSDITKFVGYYNTGAYPQTAAINPATRQIALSSGGQDNRRIRIFDITAEEPVMEIKDVDTHTLAWSGDGKYLMASIDGGGMRVWESNVTPAEIAALNRHRAERAQKRSTDAAGGVAQRKPAEPREADKRYADFRVRPDLASAQEAIDAALDKPDFRQMPEPQGLDVYNDADAEKQMLEIREATSDDSAAGIRVYRLRRALRDHPDFAPMHFLLGHALLKTNQDAPARASFIKTVQIDAGRSKLTTMTLKDLALLHESQKLNNHAAYCLGMALQLDTADVEALQLLRKLLEKMDDDERHARVTALIDKVSGDSNPATRYEPPRIKAPPDDAEKLSARQIHQQAVASVVLIDQNGAQGTGVCVIDHEYVITNAHVVEKAGAGLRVVTFEQQGDRVRRSKAVRATVVHVSRKADIALIKLATPLDELVAMPLAEKRIANGTKVYAIGNPVVGDDSMDLTITDGIISSNDRNVDGDTYVQHTASANPGHSGGPLVDEYGTIVGITTLQARIERVGFAIPADVVRDALSN